MRNMALGDGTYLARFPICAVSLALAGCIVSPAIPSWRTAPKGEQITLSADQGFIVPATIDGHAVRLRVDTGYSGIILNPSAAARVGLRAGLFESDISVGPVRVNGETGVATVSIGAAREKRRIVWFEKDITESADGVINVAHLPYDGVTLQLAPASRDDVAVSVETTPYGFWSVAYRQPVADKHIEVRLLLDAPRTLLTAAAGAHLARHNAGTWSGERSRYTIRLNVARPVQPMTFARPVPFGLVTLNSALVRTTDFKGRYALPTQAPTDPDEIVVTGPGVKSSPSLTAIVGRDQLSGCSSIHYARATRTLTLRCSPGAPAR